MSVYKRQVWRGIKVDRFKKLDFVIEALKVKIMLGWVLLLKWLQASKMESSHKTAFKWHILARLFEQLCRFSPVHVNCYGSLMQIMTNVPKPTDQAMDIEHSITLK